MIYFRIIKLALADQKGVSPANRLIPEVLEGLSKFAHLISVDFFQDLLSNLRQILRRDENQDSGHCREISAALANDQKERRIYRQLSVRDKLQCVITAFQLLTGQGEALNLDLREFQVHLYQLLPQMMTASHVGLHAQHGKTESQLLVRALDLMLFKLRPHPPISRVAAFAKRITNISLHLPSTISRQLIDIVVELIKVC